MTIGNDEAVVRWIEEKDHPQILDLMLCGYRSEEWTAKDLQKFLHATNRRNNVKVLAVEDGTVYGVLMYTLGTGTCTVRRLAVWPDYRRRGLAQYLLAPMLRSGTPWPPKVRQTYSELFA